MKTNALNSNSGVKIKAFMKFLSERKYYILTTFVGLVHALFGFIFFVTEVTPLAVFNVFSPILYFSMRWVLKKGRLLVFLLFAYVEIVVHAIAASYFVGWDSGFTQYIIAVVPLTFLGACEVTKGRKRFIVPLVLGIIASSVYVVCRKLSYVAEPRYVLPDSLQESLFLFNSTGTFVFLLTALLLFMATLSDMEQQLLIKNAILNKRASTDPLTELLNRRSMSQELEKAMNSELPFSIAMCDIDNFKQVNDSFGHEAGDLVLREVSRIITGAVSDDSPICRWGGEEILILFCHHSPREALDVCEKIRKEIEKDEIPFYSHILRITITIGVASHQSGQRPEKTIADADGKLYIGKSRGKNQVVS